MAYSAQASPVQGGPNPLIFGSSPKEKTLRLWPAVILLVLLGVVRLGWLAVDEIPPALFPVIFMGPQVLCALIALWWLAASRSRLRDRFLGFLVLAAAGGLSYWVAHPSAQSMVYLFYTLPIAIAAFVITLLLLTWFGRGVATWAAVAVAVVCFAGGTLVRNDGFSGDFRASFSWRWQPTPEDQYLTGLREDQLTSSPSTPREIPALGPVRWPEFRGPKRDGVVPGVRLNEDWTAQPPKEIWRRKVGPGWSSFAATDDLVFTQEQRGDQEAVVCYDAHTGSEVWCHAYKSRFWEVVAGAGPRATPTLYDGALFTLGAEGVLCRLNALTGALVWKRDLQADAERKAPMWGFSSSPLITHGCVVVHAGGAGDKGTLAYDVQTGALRWGAPAGDHSYSSPQLATVAGHPCVLMLTNTGIHAYDPETGKAQWEHEWKFEGHRVVQPLVIGQSSVLLGTMMGAGTRRIDLTWDGDGPHVSQRWTSLGLKPGFNDYVAHHGHLFGFDNNIFACLDLETGQKKWKDGRYGSGQVLLLPDGDQLLVISEKGELVLLRANPEKHEELTRYPVLQGKTWNHPVLVGKRLYVRNSEEAACFELSLAVDH